MDPSEKMSASTSRPIDTLGVRGLAAARQRVNSDLAGTVNRSRGRSASYMPIQNIGRQVLKESSPPSSSVVGASRSNTVASSSRSTAHKPVFISEKIKELAYTVFNVTLPVPPKTIDDLCNAFEDCTKGARGSETRDTFTRISRTLIFLDNIPAGAELERFRQDWDSVRRLELCPILGDYQQRKKQSQVTMFREKQIAPSKLDTEIDGADEEAISPVASSLELLLNSEGKTLQKRIQNMGAIFGKTTPTKISHKDYELLAEGMEALRLECQGANEGQLEFDYLDPKWLFFKALRDNYIQLRFGELDLHMLENLEAINVAWAHMNQTGKYVVPAMESPLPSYEQIMSLQSRR